MALKSIISNMMKGEKLIGNNYDIWHRKIQYLLDEKYVLETLDQVTKAPEASDHLSTNGILRPIRNDSRRNICSLYYIKQHAQ